MVPGFTVRGAAVAPGCIAHGACTPAPREKALCHMTFSTCAAFCKRALQNERRAAWIAMLKKPLFYKAYWSTRETRRAREGGLVFGPFPYARAAA